MRYLILSAALLMGFLASGHSACGQGVFGYSYGSEFGSSWFPASRVWHSHASAAKYDPRIDPVMLRAARLADQHAGRHSIARCWRFVKEALVGAGAVHSYPSTNYASQAGSELVSHHGFVQLKVRDPYSAPVGSVLVYSGHGAGHVELRTASGFASDYRSNWACRYHLLGVYAKLTS